MLWYIATVPTYNHVSVCTTSGHDN